MLRLHPLLTSSFILTIVYTILEALRQIFFLLDFCMVENIRSKLNQILENLFIRSWWVIVFLILCVLFFEQGQLKRKASLEQLSQQLKDLENDKDELMKKQKRLVMQKNSQSDPAFVELTLKKGLGVVPEGQVKVYFTENTN